MNNVITVLDAQTGNATLEICTSAYAMVLAVITLEKPSFTEAAQQITLSGVPLSAMAINTGTAALARFKDGAGTVWIQGLTVGTFGTDVIISAVLVTAGQLLTVSAASFTHS